MENNEILFTTASLLGFLQQIDELSDKDIILNEDDSAITVTIGDSTYTINKSDAEEVEVEPEVVEEVSDVADEAYAELGEAGVDVTDIDEDIVEGGLLKEALKTLAIGGLVRLTGKLLKD